MVSFVRQLFVDYGGGGALLADAAVVAVVADIVAADIVAGDVAAVVASAAVH